MRLYCSCCFQALSHLTLVTQTFSWLFCVCVNARATLLWLLDVRNFLIQTHPPTRPPQKNGVYALRLGCARRANVALYVRENEGSSHSWTVGLLW